MQRHDADNSIITGFDMDARPLIYMRPGRENTETSPRQIRHLIYNLCVTTPVPSADVTARGLST